MNVICVGKDKPIVEFTGAAIENEQVNEPVGESTGQKEQEEKVASPLVQMRAYVLGKTEDIPFKSLKELKVDYMETRKHAFEHIFQYMLQAKGIAGSKVQLLFVRDPEANMLKLVMTSGKKAYEFKISLGQVSLPDKINLHKQSSDILYADLMKLAINYSKALDKIDKMELSIKQEQTTSRSHQSRSSLWNMILLLRVQIKRMSRPCKS